MMVKADMKKQMLIEAFDVLKDSWEDKSSSIRAILKKMKNIDQQLMIDMWVYLLKKNEKLIKSDNWEADGLLNNLLNNLTSCYAEKEISRNILHNDEMIKYLFFFNKSIEKITSSVLAVLAMDGENDKLLKILEKIKNRKNLDKDYKIGTIIANMIDTIDIDEDPISPTTIDMLNNFCTTIQDPKERAVAFVACLELEGEDE